MRPAVAKLSSGRSDSRSTNHARPQVDPRLLGRSPPRPECPWKVARQSRQHHATDPAAQRSTKPAKIGPIARYCFSLAASSALTQSSSTSPLQLSSSRLQISGSGLLVLDAPDLAVDAPVGSRSAHAGLPGGALLIRGSERSLHPFRHRSHRRFRCRSPAVGLTSGASHCEEVPSGEQCHLPLVLHAPLAPW